MKNICNLCKSREYNTLFYLSGHKIVRCMSCGLVRTYNFSEPSYKKYHRDEEYQSSENLFKQFFEMRFSIINNFVKTGKVLDVGAANGVFLDIFKKKGFETYGVEPSDSYKICEKKGHHVFHTKLGALKGYKNYFNLVIANHVLEHVVDPVRFVSKINSLLQKNGYLYVDVPNFESLSSSVNKENWKYLLPTEHAYHYSPKTLGKLLEINGFKVLLIKTRSGVFEAKHPIYYLLSELFSLKKNFFYDIPFVPFNIISTFLNKGSSLGIVAIKK